MYQITVVKLVMVFLNEFYINRLSQITIKDGWLSERIFWAYSNLKCKIRIKHYFYEVNHCVSVWRKWSNILWTLMDLYCIVVSGWVIGLRAIVRLSVLVFFSCWNIKECITMNIDNDLSLASVAVCEYIHIYTCLQSTQTVMFTLYVLCHFVNSFYISPSTLPVEY